MKITPFQEQSMVQRVGGWRARRTLAQTENKTPKQNAFKPGRWVGLDSFAPGHNKTIKNGHYQLMVDPGSADGSACRSYHYIDMEINDSGE